MGGVVKFEELNIWQEARRIVKEIYQNTASIKDMGFNEQDTKGSYFDNE